jgi:hypothetical protein
MTLDFISATKIYAVSREKHLWDISVLEAALFSNLFSTITTTAAILRENRNSFYQVSFETDIETAVCKGEKLYSNFRYAFCPQSALQHLATATFIGPRLLQIQIYC